MRLIGSSFLNLPTVVKQSWCEAENKCSSALALSGIARANTQSFAVVLVHRPREVGILPRGPPPGVALRNSGLGSVVTARPGAHSHPHPCVAPQVAWHGDFRVLYQPLRIAHTMAPQVAHQRHNCFLHSGTANLAEANDTSRGVTRTTPISGRCVVRSCVR